LKYSRIKQLFLTPAARHRACSQHLLLPFGCAICLSPRSALVTTLAIWLLHFDVTLRCTWLLLHLHLPIATFTFTYICCSPDIALHCPICGYVVTTLVLHTPPLLLLAPVGFIPCVHCCHLQFWTVQVLRFGCWLRALLLDSATTLLLHLIPQLHCSMPRFIAWVDMLLHDPTRRLHYVVVVDALTALLRLLYPLTCYSPVNVIDC